MSSIASPGAGVVLEPAAKRKGGRPPLNIGVVFSIVFHAALILYLLNLVRPSLNILPEKHRQTIVELAPPLPPPPPPPPPKQQVPRPHPHPLAPPPPQQIVSQAPAPPVDAPAVAPPAPAPVEPPAPPPPPAHTVGTSVPSDYYNSLQALIQRSVQYPVRSQRNSEEGTCRVRVTFGRDGSIEGAELVKKSGFGALDGECREVFKRIARFPAIPANANPDASDFAIELPINFSLG
jgi:periplasmic protein TonB